MPKKRIGLLPTFEVGMPYTLTRFFEFLDLKIKHGGQTHEIEIDRVKVRPVDIRENVKKEWDLFVDRSTHWHKFIRAYVQHALYDGVYVLNHPTTFNAINKHASFVMLSRLGAKVPETIMIPPHTYVEDEEYYVKLQQINPRVTPQKFQDNMKSYYHYRDVWLPEMFAHHNVMFDFDGIPDLMKGYPFYLKPGQDGGGGSGVSRIKDLAEFHEKYRDSEDRVMHAQEAIDFDSFCRCMGIGPQIWPMRYLPDEPIHRHYAEEPIELTKKERERIIGEVKIVNAFFRWEYNSYEALLRNGEIFPIDYANACPDSAITSLHVHFPWVIKALVKWITFCVVTERKMRFDLNQQEFLDAGNREDLSYDERFDACLKLAKEYFQEEEFEAFCAKHFKDLDDRFVEFYEQGHMDEIIAREIQVSRFPVEEHEKFYYEYKEKLDRSVRERLS